MPFWPLEGSGTIIDVYKPITIPFLFKTRVFCACHAIPDNLIFALFHIWQNYHYSNIIDVAIKPLDIIDLIGKDIVDSLAATNKDLPIPMVEISPLNKEQLEKLRYIADKDGNIAQTLS
jgi:hypothetical protein